MLVAWMMLHTAPAVAHEGDVRHTVMDLLNDHEHSPTDADLVALGDGARDELLAIAVDPEVPKSRRGRAISALGAWPVPAVKSVLTTQLAADDPYLKRKAVLSFSRAFPEDAVTTVSPFLTSTDVQLRLATVHALEGLPSKDVEGVFRTHLQQEDNDTVKAALHKALGEAR